MSIYDMQLNCIILDFVLFVCNFKAQVFAPTMFRTSEINSQGTLNSFQKNIVSRSLQIVFIGINSTYSDALLLIAASLHGLCSICF